MTLIGTVRGIPQLYYGSEIGMAGDKNKGDADIRQDFPGGWKNDANNAFTKEGRTKEQEAYHSFTKKVFNYRKKSAALKLGKTLQFVPENNVYVFFRYTENEKVMVVINNSKEPLDTKEIENFLKLPELGIKYHRKPYEIPGTNWVMVHGDEQSIKPHGGLTALEAAKRHGKSVVCGHTHRQGISSYTQSSGGLEVSRLTGFEVGHLMDTRSTGASYMKGTFNWQAGFGVIYTDRKRVLPIAVPIEKDGSFQFEGKVYG
jgi:hypothetical protein